MATPAATGTATGTFSPLPPARLLDTRTGNGGTTPAANGTVKLQVAGKGGVPASGVFAVVLNITVTHPTAAGYITAYADGGTAPTASNLNFIKGQTVPNLVVAPVGTDGKVDLLNGSLGTVDLIADVSGYFLAGTASAGAFTSLTPARLLDTRSTATGGPSPAANGTVKLQVAGKGGVPAGVSAVVLNITVTHPTAAGYITAYADGTTAPTASNLNFIKGQTVPNLVVAPVGTDGKVDLLNGSLGTVDLIADVSGYFSAGTPSAVGAFASLNPARLLDTRTGNGGTTPAANKTVKLQVAGRGGVPASGVSAVVLNITVTHPTAAGYITAYADGTTAPTASNLNFIKGQTVPNLVVAPVGTDGKVDLLNGSLGTVDLIADVSGYFLGDTSTGATTGVISGTVTAAAGGSLGAVRVTAEPIDNDDKPGPASADPGPTTTTDGTGAYSLAGLAPGQYSVCFDGSDATGGADAFGYVAQCYLNSNPDAEDATPVTVTAGVTTTINAALVAGGGIAGSVTATDGGSPVTGVDVSVRQLHGDGGFGSATTDATGAYEVKGLPAGYYTVCFYADGATGAAPAGYLGECYDNVSLNSNAAPKTVSVSANKELSGINATLATGSGISGKVTVSGSPTVGLSGVDVVVFTVGSDGDEVTDALTGSDGTYKVTGLEPGTYDVCFDAGDATGGSSTRGYLDQCYNGVAWVAADFDPPASATSVTTTTGSIQTGINASLTTGGAVTGKVTALTATGAALSGVEVDVRNSSGDFILSTATAADGTYSLLGLNTGKYSVCFYAYDSAGGTSSTGYLDQCSSNISVTVGVTTSGVNAALAAAAGVSGTVTGLSGGAAGAAPLGHVRVTVYASDGDDLDDVTTAADGTYLLGGLDADTYTVCFDAENATGGASATGYLGQCYNNKALDPENATPIVLGAGALKTGVNAVLAVGGAVHGTVTTPLTPAGTAPLANVDVTAYAPGDEDGDIDIVADEYTASDGTYALNGLAAGSYTICYDASDATGGPSTTGYVDECYDNVVSVTGEPPTTVTPVTVKPGAVTTADASLTIGGAISGTVTGGGAPLTDVEVDVYTRAGDEVDLGADTSNDGTYTVVGLPAGSYTVCFDGENANGGSSTGGYVSECYQDKAYNGYAPPSGTTAVSVTAGMTHSGIDADLTAGASISGTVTAKSSGAALEDVDVRVFTAGGDELSGQSTDTDGTYEVDSLPAGTYTVCFDASSARADGDDVHVSSECYSGIAWNPDAGLPTGTTGIALNTGQAKTGVDEALAPPAGIAGKVTAASGGAALDGVDVEVYTHYDSGTGTGGDYVGSDTTGADGTYTVAPLATATAGYDVSFDGSGASGGPSVAGYLTVQSATPVTVAAGKLTTLNQTLGGAAGISGKVTEAGTNAAIRDPDIEVFDRSNDNQEVYDFTTESSSDDPSAYEILGLTPSTAGYTVCVSDQNTSSTDPTGHLSQCYSAKAWDGESDPPSTSAKVAATVNVVTPNINFSLAVAGAISGKVTETNGDTAGDVSVYVFTSTGDFVGSGYVDPDGDGSYTVGGVPASTTGYAVCFDAEYADDSLASECYNNKAWDPENGPTPPPGTTKVVVTLGKVASGINAVLAAA